MLNVKTYVICFFYFFHVRSGKYPVLNDIVEKVQRGDRDVREPKLEYHQVRRVKNAHCFQSFCADRNLEMESCFRICPPVLLLTVGGHP